MRGEVMRAAYLMAVAMMLPLVMHAAEDQHQHQHVHDLPVAGAAAATEAIIVVTVNPEVRVSAALAGVWPPRTACGKPVELPVKIINQAFLTSRLEVRLVGESPAGVALEFDRTPLSGVPEEMRTLRITLPTAATVDLTAAFRAPTEIPDLGGRDRVHFVLRCQ
jgi:hypothetical protein